LKIIAGPCQHEDFVHSYRIAQECKRVCEKYGFEYYFKASFDKANRSHNDSQRGVGLELALQSFKSLKNKLDIKIVTDVHEIEQVNLLHSVDVLQIPALLCRQTDLIQAACATGKIVNIKKGQFMAPKDVQGILSKTKGAKEVWITERGTSFGYGHLINDFTGMYDLLSDLGSKFVYDITHSVQRPGGNGSSTGGDRKYVPHLARAGAALGISSFFIEVHEDPDNAPSDGDTMLRLEDFERVIDDIYRCSYTR